MQPTPSADADRLTSLLVMASDGNVEALNELFPLVYDELRRLARSRRRGERSNHTLNTTALVHEAYMRLVQQNRVQWQNRAHFYAVASRAMRRILVNYAETRRSAKRGGGAAHASLEEAIHFSDDQVDELLALNEGLERLKQFNPRGADVVVLRFFGGLTHDEIAHVMGIATITVRRAWVTARSWLRRELRESLPGWEQSGLRT
jgi:RNA polymerase sigma factor (TIGR02999 family)